MKQSLLIMVLVAFASTLSAQDVIWTEDFSAGLNGWSINPISCGSNAGAQFGDNSGPETGIWDLTEAFVNGESTGDLPEGTIFRWSFLNDVEYTLQFFDPEIGDYGTVYATYSIDENNILTSSIEEASVVADGAAFAETTANGIVEWATNMSFEDLTDILPFIGVGSPTAVLSDGGNIFTYTTMQDGDLVELVMTKSSDCGTMWTWSPNGNLGYGVFGQNPGAAIVDSETRANGVMTMNNIFQMTLGDAGVVPTPNPPPYPQYTSELISPPIDISGADRALSVSVTQFMAYLNTPADAPNGLKTSFAISTDDGANWSPATDLNENFATNTLRSNRVTVPILNAYTTGSDEIRIKFTFSTDFYFWGIDDISIQERIGYDIQANANFFAIPDNVLTPYSQLQPQYFMADIQNNGGLTAENVNLNLTINNDTDGSEVYNITKLYGDLPADSLAENDFFDTTMPLDLDPSPASIGSYSGTYTLSQDSMDVNPDNNTLEFAFEVTDTLFSKETGRTRGIFLTNDQSWYIGNSYYINNADGGDWYARYVSFMVDNASDIPEDGSGAVTILLYESDGDADGDGRISDVEYNFSPIAFNDYTFDGSEDEELITVPVDLEGVGVPLSAEKYYFIVIQYSGANENDNLAISASEDYNYAANNFITDSLGVAQYSDVVDLTGEAPNFFSGGFGGTVVPIVRMSIGDNPDLEESPITALEEILPAEYGVKVFPNPATEQFSMDVDFPEQLDATLRFYDQTGRILFTNQYDQLSQGRFNYNVSQLAAGVYYLQLDTALGARIEKVVVQK